MMIKFNLRKLLLIPIFLLVVLISESQQFQCPDKFGHYPDSEDCSKYYICDHGRPLETKCDKGLQYNTHLKTCDWPRNVQCGSGGDRVHSVTNRDIKKHSTNKKQQKSHPLSSPPQQTNQLLPHNYDQWNSEPKPDSNFDTKFDDSPPLLEPDFPSITPSHRPQPPPRSSPKPLIRDSPPLKPSFPEFKPNTNSPTSRSPSPQPLALPLKQEEPDHEEVTENNPRNPDYDYESEPDYYDYEEGAHDSQKEPLKDDKIPQNSIESTSKAPAVKRMGWLPHDHDAREMDQYHWSVDDAVNYSKDKPRIPDEAFVRMRDFRNVEKDMEEDDSPNEGEPPSDDEDYEEGEGEGEGEGEEEENVPPPPPPPKGNGLVKYNYANDRPLKVVRYDDEEESQPVVTPRAQPPLNSEREAPKPKALPIHISFDSREGYKRQPQLLAAPQPNPQSSSEITGSRHTNTYSKPLPKTPALKPNKQTLSPNLMPIPISNQNKFNNDNKPKGKLIKSIPRQNQKIIVIPRPVVNQNRPKVVKPQNNVQSVKPSIHQLLNDFKEEIPETLTREKNFAQEFRDSIINNYMNNNKPNYILNDKDFNDETPLKAPIISGEEDSVRDFDKDFEPVNDRIRKQNNEKQIKQNSNKNLVKFTKVNVTEDKPNFREKAAHRYANTDVIVKQQRAQDSVSSLSNVSPTVSIDEKQKIIKNPTNYSLVINHKSSTNDYKLPMKRPPQNLYEDKPLTNPSTTKRPNISTPKPKIRIKPQKVKKVIQKNKPKKVVEEDIEYYQNPKPTQTPIHSEPQQNSRYIRAEKCSPEYCTPPDCRCGGIDIPGGFEAKEIPQIILLTFDDSVNDLNRDIYDELFNSGRNNPNGCPVLGTFYVSHEWTDYGQVQSLYSRGHEMASHSVTHSFGEKFSKDLWLKEVSGQRELLHLYGGVKLEDVRGMRAPFLQTGGNTMFEMLYEANFTYDSSLPVYDINPPYFPYTLDYAINHECMITPCPTKSFPGLWEVGMVMWEDLRGGRCSMADACFNPNTEQEVYEMIKNNFNRHYTTNRAPFGIYFHSRWFLTDHNRKGFIRFMDEINGLNDAYFLTNWQMIEWMRNPTPLSEIKDFKPWYCDFRDRPQECGRPHNCKVKLRSETRVFKTCQSCPKVYPWRGNNGLKG